MAGAFRLPANPVLERAYANTSSSVAFLDETFDHGEHGNGRFYVFTGVIVERSQMKALRDELRDIAGGTFWHTTDELLSEEGRKKWAACWNFWEKVTRFA